MLTQKAYKDYQDVYFDYWETVESVWYNVMTKSHFSIESRLFSQLCFAMGAGTFFYPDTGDFSESKMAREIEKVSDDIYETRWLRQFHNQRVNLARPMSMIQPLLLKNLQNMHPELKRLLRSAWRIYADDSHAAEIMELNYASETAPAACRDMAKAYRRSRDRVNRYFGIEIQWFIEKYCTDFLSARSYTDDVSLFAYAQRLILHVALLKYCLFSSPRIRKVVAAYESSDIQIGMRRQDIVDAFYTAVREIIESFTVGLESDDTPLLLLRQEMENQEISDLSHTVMFILF